MNPYFESKVKVLRHWKEIIDEVIGRFDGLNDFPANKTNEYLSSLQHAESDAINMLLHDYLKDLRNGDAIASFIRNSMDSAIDAEELEREDAEFNH